jgi:hypothetical protein
MSAGGYCETVHGAMVEEKKTGKRKQNVQHYKPFSSSRGRRGLEGGMIRAHHYPSLFELYVLQAQLAASQCAPADVLTSPHLTTTNLVPRT